MRFVPFHLKDYPFIDKDLSSIEIDPSIARLGKNAIRLEDRIIFSANFDSGMKSVEVPLDQKGYSNANISIPEKMCLKRILTLLEEVDERDSKAVNSQCGSQFGVMKAIRGFDQNFGGRRFVGLARDIIDNHMGVCLYPFMVCDLVMGVYLAYNKNVNRDVGGFMSAIVEFIAEFVQKSDDLRNILQNIKEKSSENLYQIFLEKGLQDPRISDAVARSVVDSFAKWNQDDANYAWAVPVAMVARFPKEILISFFQTVDPFFDNFVLELFDYLGDECDLDYLRAYMRNPQFRSQTLLSIPASRHLDQNETKKLKLRDWVFYSASETELVQEFKKLTDTEEQKRFIALLVDAGNDNLSRALEGQAFSTRSMAYETFYELLPFMNLDLDHNRLQAIAFVRSVIEYDSQGVDKLLLGLHHPAFTDIVRDALERGKVRRLDVSVILADRFHCPGAIRLKEWH